MAGPILLEHPTVGMVEPSSPEAPEPPAGFGGAFSWLFGVAVVMTLGFGLANVVLVESRNTNPRSEILIGRIDVGSLTVTDQAAPRRWTEYGFATDTAMGRIKWEQVELLPDATGDVITNPIWTPRGFWLITQRDQLLQMWASPGGREWDVVGQAVIQPGITISGLIASRDGLNVVLEDGAGTITEQPLPGFDSGFQPDGPFLAGNGDAVTGSEVPIAVYEARRLALSVDTACCDQITSRTGARVSVDEGPWQHLEQVGGTQTFGEGVAGGPAGWGITWHQCDPGCGQEVWLSPDLVTWDRIRMSNSARDQVFFITSGIAIGANSVVVSGVAHESAPYSGAAVAAVWVGTVEGFSPPRRTPQKD